MQTEVRQTPARHVCVGKWEPQSCPEFIGALLALSRQGTSKGVKGASSSLSPLQPEMSKSFDILGGKETGTEVQRDRREIREEGRKKDVSYIYPGISVQFTTKPWVERIKHMVKSQRTVSEGRSYLGT